MSQESYEVLNEFSKRVEWLKVAEYLQRLRAEVYREALIKCLTGGNSIASALINAKFMPDDIKTQEQAATMLEDGKLTYEQYEMWICWKCIMDAREMVRRHYPEPNGPFEP